MKKTKFLTNEEKEKISSMWVLGHSKYQISKEINRSIEAITNHIHRFFDGRTPKETINPMYMPYKGSFRFLDQEEKIKIKKMFDKGMTIREIAQEVGRNKSTIYDYVRTNLKDGE